MTRRLAILTILLAVALLVPAPLAADEGDTILSVGPMYGVGMGDTRVGMGGALSVSYGVNDRFLIRGGGFYDSQYVKDTERWGSLAGATVGAGSALMAGEAQVIPYVFGDVGVGWLEDVEPAVALDLSVEAGFDYLITSTMSVGLACRASMFIGEIDLGDAMLYNALLRISFTL